MPPAVFRLYRKTLKGRCAAYVLQFMQKEVDEHEFVVPVSKVLCGRAIAEAVSRWLPTAAARVQSHVWLSGIYGGQSGVGAGFLRVLRFPMLFIPPNSPSSQSPVAGTIGQ
jgi:hypothetical protein